MCWKRAAWCGPGPRPSLPQARMSNIATSEFRRAVILLLGRIALGAIFVKSGLQKLLALSAFAATLASRGVPQSSVWAVIVATGISHRYWEFAEAARRLQESQFLKNLSIIGGFLLLFATGSGRFGLDALLARRKTTSPGLYREDTK